MEPIDFLMIMMIGFVVFIVLILSLVSVYLCIGSCFFYFSPSVPSTGLNKKCILKEVQKQLSQKENLTIMDLGSGWGSLLLPLAQTNPKHLFVGIERGYLPYLVSRWRGRKYKNIKFYHENFFYFDISNADIILLFQLTHLMKKITGKCRQECHKGCLIYANRFPLQIKAEQILAHGSAYDTVYKYRI